MTDIDVTDMNAWLEGFSRAVTENESVLTELDSTIGDADHGANLTRGMNAVIAALSAEQFETFADLFTKVGMTLVTTVGGASGPLYGTFFLRLGSSAGKVESVDASGFGDALQSGLEGIIARGRAEVGDKTLVDALAPAVEAWKAAAASGSTPAAAAQAALAAAETGRDATGPLVARKGRASYLGERSAGHLDPGATSLTLLFGALADALAKKAGA